MKKIEGINPNSRPKATGCEECLATGGGGCIYAGALNAAISDVVTAHLGSMPRSMRFSPGIPLWPASNRSRNGSSTIEQGEL
jgi:hypothetical protein